ncbi:MAG: acyl-CoA thioesterase [Acidimicrobiales bacterium]|nr:acyl-CoA thioesterase [Acidimicrobiales bacterium]HRW37829.1 thioesterase family protein [Aquihabitans sp.]
MAEPAPGWPFRDSIRVRYQEVDMQQVVFNGHYLGWCDVVCARWFEEALGWTGTDDDIDWMVVRATIDWQGSATYGDVVDIDCGVGRWGTTSFDLRYQGTVCERPVFTATVTSVCVRSGTKEKVVVPERLQHRLALVRDP